MEAARRAGRAPCYREDDETGVDVQRAWKSVHLDSVDAAGRATGQMQRVQGDDAQAAQWAAVKSLDGGA